MASHMQCMCHIGGSREAVSGKVVKFSKVHASWSSWSEKVHSTIEKEQAQQATQSACITQGAAVKLPKIKCGEVSCLWCFTHQTIYYRSFTHFWRGGRSRNHSLGNCPTLLTLESLLISTSHELCHPCASKFPEDPLRQLLHLHNAVKGAVFPYHQVTPQELLVKTIFYFFLLTSCFQISILVSSSLIKTIHLNIRLLGECCHQEYLGLPHFTSFSKRSTSIPYFN